MDQEQQHRMNADTYRREAQVAQDMVARLEQQRSADVNAWLHKAEQIEMSGGELSEAQSYRDAAQRKSEELQVQITKAQSDAANYEQMAHSEDQRADAVRGEKRKGMERLREAGKMIDRFSQY